VFCSLKSTFVSFLWVYGILMFFRVCVYGITEEMRSAGTKGQGVVVAGKSISHHHHLSAWHRTEL